MNGQCLAAIVGPYLFGAVIWFVLGAHMVDTKKAAKWMFVWVILWPLAMPIGVIALVVEGCIHWWRNLK